MTPVLTPNERRSCAFAEVVDDRPGGLLRVPDRHDRQWTVCRLLGVKGSQVQLLSARRICAGQGLVRGYRARLLLFLTSTLTSRLPVVVSKLVLVARLPCRLRCPARGRKRRNGTILSASEWSVGEWRAPCSSARFRDALVCWTRGHYDGCTPGASGPRCVRVGSPRRAAGWRFTSELRGWSCGHWTLASSVVRGVNTRTSCEKEVISREPWRGRSDARVAEDHRAGLM